MQLLFLSSLFILLQSILAKDTLVIHDGSFDLKEDYTMFLNDLYEEIPEESVVLKNVKDESVTTIQLISKIDSSENLYDNIIILPLNYRHLNKKLSSSHLLKFASNNMGNILVIDGVNGSNDEVRIFLNQLGIYPAPKGYKLYDEFSKIEEGVLSIPIEGNLQETNILSSTLKKDDILYNGNSVLLSNNEMLIPILTAPKTSYNYNPKKLSKTQTEQEGQILNDFNYWGLGSQNYLIASFQSLTNSRVSYVGSSDFISDKLYRASNYKNERIMKDVLTWTMNNKNILAISYLEYYKTENNSFNSKMTKDSLKVKDEVVYNIGISEYKNGEWVPYVSDDIQLEVTMLDPYFRINLNKTSYDSKVLSINNPLLADIESNTTFFKAVSVSDYSKTTQFYTSKFNLPDQHGMFKFSIQYRNPGFSFLDYENIFTLRNLATDEYEKSWEIVNSWVYLTSIFALIAAWLIFVVLFLFNNKVNNKATITKKNI